MPRDWGGGRREPPSPVPGGALAHPHPLIYTPLLNSMWLHHTALEVRVKGSTWCIHMAEGAKLDQNGLKMGSFHLFVHPKSSRVTFGKMCF